MFVATSAANANASSTAGTTTDTTATPCGERGREKRNATARPEGVLGKDSPVLMS